MSGLPDPSALPRPWLASYPPGVPATYQIPAAELTRVLDDAARDFPGRVAVVAGRERVDYATLSARVDAVLDVFARRDIDAGDRVLLGLPNTALLPVVLLAIWRLGAIAVPVASTLRGDQLIRIAEHADVSAVIGTSEVIEALGRGGVLPSVALQADGDEWPTKARGAWLRERGVRIAAVVLRRSPPTMVGRLRDELGVVVPAREVRSAADAEAVALIAYEPGNSHGHGVTFRHRELMAAAFQARLWIPDVQAGRERVLVAGPLHEVTSLSCGLLSGLLSAATVVLFDDGADAASLARTLEGERVTILYSSPDRLAALLADDKAAKRDLTSLRVIIAIGPCMDPQVAAHLERRTSGARVRAGFATAESGSITHAQPIYGRINTAAVGIPVTSTLATVVKCGDLSVPCALNEVGQLLVAGPQVATAYWDDEVATSRRFADGWLITDELVTMDADGVFSHVGRIGDAIPSVPSRFVFGAQPGHRGADVPDRGSTVARSGPDRGRGRAGTQPSA